MLWELSITVKHLIKKASPALLSFKKIDGEILEAEKKIYASLTVPEMLRVMHENYLFDTFPERSKVVHILAVILATSCSIQRSFSPVW